MNSSLPVAQSAPGETTYHLLAPLVINYPRRIRNRARRRMPVLENCTLRKRWHRRPACPVGSALNSNLSPINK